MRQSWGGVGGRDPTDFGLGVLGIAGCRERVSENTIAYFAQKVCWKVVCFIDVKNAFYVFYYFYKKFGTFFIF